MNEKLQGKIASIQYEFEPIFWVHSDPEVVLSFAEKKIKNKEASNLESYFCYSSRTPVPESIEVIKKPPLRNNVLKNREDVLSLIGTHDLFVQQHFILEDGSESRGRIADIFTIESTARQLGLSPETDLGNGMIARSVVSSFKVKEIKTLQTISNEKVFTLEDKSLFIKSFSTHFMANWAALNYSDFCTRGLHKELGKPPVEDAMFLAEQAWDHLVEIVGLE